MSGNSLPVTISEIRGARDERGRIGVAVEEPLEIRLGYDAARQARSKTACRSRCARPATTPSWPPVSCSRNRSSAAPTISRSLSPAGNPPRTAATSTSCASNWTPVWTSISDAAAAAATLLHDLELRRLWQDLAGRAATPRAPRRAIRERGPIQPGHTDVAARQAACRAKDLRGDRRPARRGRVHRGRRARRNARGRWPSQCCRQGNWHAIIDGACCRRVISA